MQLPWTRVWLSYNGHTLEITVPYKYKKLIHPKKLSRCITKPTTWPVCAQRRLRSAWASAQSDQSLRCPHEEALDPKLSIKRTVKTLISLGGCPGWSESSLGAHAILLVLSCGGSIDVMIQKFIQWAGPSEPAHLCSLARAFFVPAYNKAN